MSRAGTLIGDNDIKHLPSRFNGLARHFRETDMRKLGLAMVLLGFAMTVSGCAPLVVGGAVAVVADEAIEQDQGGDGLF
jgi:hypothetical protein